MFSVVFEKDKAVLKLEKADGTTESTRLPRAAYDVFTSIPTEGVRNKELQFLLIEQLKCSQGRATALMERFTPGYKAFSGIALLEAFTASENNRERYYRPVTDGVGTAANMLTHTTASNVASTVEVDE